MYDQHSNEQNYNLTKKCIFTYGEEKGDHEKKKTMIM